MNFGTIKDTYAKLLIDWQLKESPKNYKEKISYKNFIKQLVESPILKTEFVVYKNIENSYFDSELTATEYLKENISLFNKFKKKDILKENKKLADRLIYGYKGRVLTTENNDKFSIDLYLMSTTSNVHEALNNLIILEKNANTINTLHESFEIVKKWLTTPKIIKEEVKIPKIDVNKFLTIVTKKYNEKYSNITEEEKKVIKIVLSADNKEKEIFLKKMIKESIDLINNSLKEFNSNLEVKGRLLEVKDVIYNLEFNEKTFKEDLLKVYTLKTNL